MKKLLVLAAIVGIIVFASTKAVNKVHGDVATRTSVTGTIGIMNS